MKTILFVENDPVVVTMYRNRLQSEGFRIETAEDGLDALRILSSFTPDLVTLDLMLPKLSGADVLRFIRSDPRLKHIPVILFSNAYMTELGEDAVLSSANKRLLKAYSTPTLLLESIRELLAPAPKETNGASAVTAPTAPAGLTDGASAASGNGSASTQKPQAATSQSTSPLERQQFLKEVRAESVTLHEHCRCYVKAPASKEGQQHLVKLHEVVHRLSTNASRTDCSRITNLMKAFDALLSEVEAKPAWASPSVLQTIAQATDCLDLVMKSEEAGTSGLTASKVLVVDDDLVCNRVMVSSLKRTNLEPISVQDPKEGLRLLQNNRFDAILLDVNMPEMTGFELCEQLRRLSHCKTTPVIFVTAYSNFQNRTQGVLSGGDDFITKPVSPLELALKVTIHMLKAHSQRGGAPLPEIRPPLPEVTTSVLQSLAAVQANQLKNGEALSQDAANVSSLAAGNPISTGATVPPPVPAEFVTAEAQSPLAIQPAAPALAEPSGAAPPNLFLSTTETATSTGEAPAVPESQPAAAETPNDSLQPVGAVTKDPNQSIASMEVPPAPASDPFAVNVAAEATQPSAPSIVDTFLAEPVQLAAPQNLSPTAGLQNNAVETGPSSGAASALLPPLPELIAFTPPAPASAIQQTFEPALPLETLAFLAAQDPMAAAALPSTTESQNSVVESTTAPDPTPSTAGEPISSNVIAETPQPAAETPINPASGAQTEKPFVAEPQTPTTDSLNSVASPVAEQAWAQPPVEPAAEDAFAQPQSPAPNAEIENTVGAEAQTPTTESLNHVASPASETSPRSPIETVAENASVPPQPATTSPETGMAPPKTFVESSQTVVDLQASLIPAADSEYPSVPEPQAAATESPNSLTESDSAASMAEVAPTANEPEPVQPESSTLPEVVNTSEAATEVAIATEGTAPPEFNAAPDSPAPNDSDRVFEQIVFSVTCMIYGDCNATEMNLRMVRLALESYKINELVRRPAAPIDPQSGTGNH
jgi:CheY-like chemotaxis protein